MPSQIPRYHSDGVVRRATSNRPDLPAAGLGFRTRKPRRHCQYLQRSPSAGCAGRWRLCDLQCSGTITMAAPITIVVNTTIDGSGQAVTISGNHTVPVFTVKPEVTLKPE